MIFIRTLLTAFSMYSRIPVAGFKCDSNDMRYVTSAFPFVGIIVGGVFYLWFFVAQKLCIKEITAVLILSVIPCVITGGFHIDGFIDTTDARSSYYQEC